MVEKSASLLSLASKSRFEKLISFTNRDIFLTCIPGPLPSGYVLMVLTTLVQSAKALNWSNIGLFKLDELRTPIRPDSASS